jgi:hypothetical protein
MNAQLRLSEQELLREHEYAAPYVVAGHRLHGGLDDQGNYLSPRTLLRWPAVRNWTAALRARGGDLLACSSSVLAGARVPNTQQQKLLLQAGLGQTFWNTLTITGLVEARGRVLAEIPIPSFQPAIVEDISEMAIGHLERGLLKAHGLDEGGEPSKGIGGHDVMWFALRDLAFGPTAFGAPEMPATITRADQSEPMPEIARPQARMLSFLLNLLMIELRAEIGFSNTEALLCDPELFVERRSEAGQAAVVVQRIRQDEQVHLDSLRLLLGEARALHFRTVDGANGGQIAGHELIDPFWERLVQWATVEQPQLMADRNRALLTARILEHPDGPRVLREFDALAAAAA